MLNESPQYRKILHVESIPPVSCTSQTKPGVWKKLYMPFYEPFQESRAVATLETGKICNGLTVLSSVKAANLLLHKHKDGELNGFTIISFMSRRREISYTALGKWALAPYLFEKTPSPYLFFL